MSTPARITRTPYQGGNSSGRFLLPSLYSKIFFKNVQKPQHIVFWVIFLAIFTTYCGVMITYTISCGWVIFFAQYFGVVKDALGVPFYFKILRILIFLKVDSGG